MFRKTRTTLATLGAIGAAALGGSALAGAATGSNSGSSSSAAPASPNGSPPAAHTVNGKTETALTGTTKDKVEAAALAKVKGTVERVETNVDSSAPYEAHIRKADGTEVEVQVSSDFTVAAVNEMGAGHP